MLSKINFQKYFFKIIIVICSIILAIWIYNLQIPAGNIFYEFQFHSEEVEHENGIEEVELSLDIPKTEAPVQTDAFAFMLNQTVQYLIEPRALDNQEMTLTFTESTKAPLLTKIVVLVKQRDGMKEKGFITNELFMNNVSYKDNQIIMDQLLSESLAKMATNNQPIKILLFVLLIFTNIFILLIPSSKKKYYAPAYIFIILFYMAYTSANSFYFGRAYYYNSGDTNEIVLKQQEIFNQEIEIPKKHLSSIEYELQLVLEENNEEEIPEDLVFSQPQVLVTLTDEETNEIIDAQYVFYNTDPIQVVMDFSRKNEEVYGHTLLLAVENIASIPIDTYITTVEDTSTFIQNSSISGGKMKMNFLFNDYSTSFYASLILTLFALLYIVVIVGGRYKRYKWISKIVIYTIMLGIFILQVTIVGNVTEKRWDEGAHVSFTVSLEAENNIFLPNYEDSYLYWLHDNGHIPMFMPEDESSDIATFDSRLPANYQIHPPLYYQILRYFGGTERIDKTHVKVNYSRMSLISHIIAFFSVGIWFLIGYIYIKQSLVYHVLFASVITGCSNLIYASSQIGNDVMTLMASGLVVFALFRLTEYKYDWWSYLCLSSGLSIAVLTKMTVGPPLLIASILFLIWQLKEKNIKIINNVPFFFSLLIYLIPLIYYIQMYNQYHSFMPSFADMHPEDFYNSMFYHSLDNRLEMYSLPDFIYWFWRTLISNLYQPLQGNMSTNNGYLIPVWGFISKTIVILFFTAAFIPGKNGDRKWNVIRFCSFGAWYFLIHLFLNTYQRYYFDGYLGGVQLRYFLYAVPMMGWILVDFSNKLFRRLALNRYSEAISIYLLSSICLFGGFLFPYILISL